MKIKPSDLNNIFVTADSHLGHENIIKFCNRPFETVAEMDQVLIDNWNKVVGPDNDVYHLSDFTLGAAFVARQYFRQLNGRIKVLANPWHHDKRWLQDVAWLPGRDVMGVFNISDSSSTRFYSPVDILPPMVVLEIEGMGNEGRPLAVTLCHYPLAVWDRKRYGAWHLHGHIHTKNTDGESGEFRLDVGVDQMNYSPVHLGGVLEFMLEKGW